MHKTGHKSQNFPRKLNSGNISSTIRKKRQSIITKLQFSTFHVNYCWIYKWIESINAIPINICKLFGFYGVLLEIYSEFVWTKILKKYIRIIIATIKIISFKWTELQSKWNQKWRTRRNFFHLNGVFSFKKHNGI